MAQILLVEDDQTLREVIEYQLAHQGHDVRSAEDGVEGLRLLQEQPPDVVLLDVMLPRLSGLDLLRVLRDRWAMPVIIISARDGEADRVAGLEQGADDYVTKPFSVRELVARVEAALRRAHLTASTQQAEVDPGAGGIVIRIDSHEAFCDGTPLTLSPKEFELLAYFAAHPNIVCSRDAILDAVWGYAYEGETRTIDIHVHWLRQKIEPHPSRPVHLVTVRNYGYKFVPTPAASAG